MEKLINQVREMSIEIIQVINGRISRWGAMADNQIVGGQDVLLSGNKPILSGADDQASNLGLTGGDIRRTRTTKKLTEIGAEYKLLEKT